jgi:predicted  nucleic acid-binding Zn-ribbon protein
MGKFLRVLVVIIFLLTAASLTLAILLFNKREMLKGRTNELEQGLIKISRTIEAEPPAVPEDPAEYPARDISDCTDEILDNPQKSDFWKKYKQQLESLDQDVLDIKARERELMSYYKIDPATTKPELNTLTGAKITTGPGTTQGVIDDILAKAEAQYDLLTETRQQLEDIRIELVDTINELNGKKVTLREKLNKIVDLNNQIMELNRTISNLRNQIAEQQETIQSLESDVANLEQEKRKLEEDNEGLELAKKELKATVRSLRDRISVLTGPGSEGGGGSVMGGGTAVMTVNIPPGVKGSVADVDQDHQFIVMKFDQTFIDELRNVTTDNRLPLVSLIVQRGDGQFVSKVRLKQLDEDDKLAIGEIMIDWQQGPIKIGDQVLYQ